LERFDTAVDKKKHGMIPTGNREAGLMIPQISQLYQELCGTVVELKYNYFR
jgi:hypothetical protein